jgi:hypothetical protein
VFITTLQAANTSEEESFLIDGKRRFLTDKLLLFNVGKEHERAKMVQGEQVCHNLNLMGFWPEA